MWFSGGFPVSGPLVAVGEAAQAGHAVEAGDAPAGGVGFEAAADQVFAGSFDLAAADAPTLAQTFGVVQVIGVWGEVVPQAIEGGLVSGAARNFAQRSEGACQRVDPGPALLQQYLAGLRDPGGRLLRSLIKCLTDSCDVFEDVKDVENPVGMREVFALLFPEPLRAVCQHRDDGVAQTLL